MSCHRCRNSARRNQRCLPSPRHLQRQTLSFGVLLLSQLSISIAIVIILHSATLCISFAPPLSVVVVTESPSSSLATLSVSSKTQCPRNSGVEMNAKKRRRKKLPTYMGGEDDNRIDVPELISSVNVNRNDSPKNENNDVVLQKPKRTTLSGGPSLIFEMARRMLVWDDELYDSGMLNDAGSRPGEDNKEALPQPPPPKQLAAFPPSISTILSPSPLLATEVATSPLPRWRPSAIRQQSISNVNPAFRTSSPIMTNAGYAGILRRNSRKRNKPSMWRHCLRIYNKMGELENGIIGDSTGDSATSKNMGRGGTENYYLNYLSSSGGSRKIKRVKRGVAHHEAALVAASKLGMWEEAILIFQSVESSSSNKTVTVSTGSNDRTRRGEDDCVTDNMILSVISACVKGSKVKHAARSSAPFENSGIDGAGRANDTSYSRGFNTTRRTISPSQQKILRTLTVDERRKPLDMARDILLSMEEKHGIPLVSRHINPLASAYNRLGLCREASALLNEHLKDRTPPPPPPALLKNQYTSPSPKSRLWRGNRELLSDNPSFEGVPLVEWNDESLMNEDEVDSSLNDDDDYLIERTQLNIHEMKSKDRASYSLLVQSAAMEGNWTNAVLELKRMTAAGFHPNSRERNSWNEVMERGCRPAGNGVKNAIEIRRTEQRRQRWKKKRDGIWLGNLS